MPKPTQDNNSNKKSTDAPYLTCFGCSCMGCSIPVAIVAFIIGLVVAIALGGFGTNSAYGSTPGSMCGADAQLVFPTQCSDSAMAEAINRYIKEAAPTSSYMQGKGEDIVRITKSIGINPFLTVAQAGHENQFGTNPRPKPGVNSTGCNNPFGIKGRGTAGVDGPATDGTGGHYAAYTTVEDGLGAHARLIQNYLTGNHPLLNGRPLHSLAQIITLYRSGRVITDDSQADAASRSYAEDVAKRMATMFSYAGCQPETAACENLGGGVPLYSQQDPRWSSIPLHNGTSTMGESGCAISSAAMVIASYGEDITPADLAPMCNNGIDFDAVARQYNLPGANTINNADTQTIISYLNKQNPVIVRVTGLPYTSAQHYLVVTGYDAATDTFQINDSGPRKITQTPRSELEGHMHEIIIIQKPT